MKVFQVIVAPLLAPTRCIHALFSTEVAQRATTGYTHSLLFILLLSIISFNIRLLPLHIYLYMKFDTLTSVASAPQLASVYRTLSVTSSRLSVRVGRISDVSKSHYSQSRKDTVAILKIQMEREIRVEH